MTWGEININASWHVQCEESKDLSKSFIEITIRTMKREQGSEEEEEEEMKTLGQRGRLVYMWRRPAVCFCVCA